MYTDVADNDLVRFGWLLWMRTKDLKTSYNHIQFWNVLQTQYILAILEAHVISSTQLQWNTVNWTPHILPHRLFRQFGQFRHRIGTQIQEMFCFLVLRTDSTRIWRTWSSRILRGFFPTYRLRMGQLRSFLLTGAKASSEYSESYGSWESKGPGRGPKCHHFPAWKKALIASPFLWDNGG